MMKDVEKEIEVMKALRGNPWIVEYLGSEVRRTAGTAGHGSGWEVFILMEFCSGTSSCLIRCPDGREVCSSLRLPYIGGGIIDLLNKRLRDRLKEAEILSIFADVCEAVAYMHSLPKPLLHRDLKVCIPFEGSRCPMKLNVASVDRSKTSSVTRLRQTTRQAHHPYHHSATNYVISDPPRTLRHMHLETNAKLMNRHTI